MAQLLYMCFVVSQLWSASGQTFYDHPLADIHTLYNIIMLNFLIMSSYNNIIIHNIHAHALELSGPGIAHACMTVIVLNFVSQASLATHNNNILILLLLCM